jgi:hypothetical protein
VCSKSCATDDECGPAGEAVCRGNCDQGKTCAKLAFTGGVGEACDGGKTCKTGLSCLPFLLAQPSGACTSSGDVCSKTCTDDAGCADLGPKAKCFGCGETRTCGLTK